MFKPFTEKEILVYSGDKEEVAEVFRWIAQAEHNLNLFYKLLNEEHQKGMRGVLEINRGVDAIVFLTREENRARLLPRLDKRKMTTSALNEKMRAGDNIFRQTLTPEQKVEIFQETSRKLEITGRCEIVSYDEIHRFFPAARLDANKDYQVVFLCIDEVNSFIEFMHVTFNMEVLETRVARYFHVKPDSKYFETKLCGRLNFLMKIIFLHELGHAMCNHNLRKDCFWTQEESEANFFASVFLLSNINELFLLLLVSLYADAYDKVIFVRMGYLTREGVFAAVNQPDEIWDALIRKKYLI
jgi:hypothetical protein